MREMSEEVKELPKPILIEDLGMMYATENSKERKRFGMYECGFCGNKFRTQTSFVKSGHTKSCGCYNKRRVIETHKTHGLAGHRLYGTWAKIKDRTLNSNCKEYNDYGGRGISICEECENDFKAFYDWSMSNGYEENKGLSIDRIDNDGNYCPENCRWTNITIQSRNQRIQKNNTSGYKGVHYVKDKGKYRAQIRLNYKRVNLGYFLTAEEGAIAYNNYIIENNLEGFILNKIPKEYLSQNLREDRN